LDRHVLRKYSLEEDKDGVFYIYSLIAYVTKREREEGSKQRNKHPEKKINSIGAELRARILNFNHIFRGGVFF
jgi:hypothetical protein